MRNLSWPSALLAALLLAGCGEPPKKAEGEKPEEPVTGLHALYQMFGSARAWAPDVQVLHLTSLHLSGTPTRPGKAAGWQATFVSPSLQQARAYTFSVVEVSVSLRKGIFPDAPRTWRAGSDHPFLIAGAKKDSDDAYQIALTKAADYNKQHPGMTVSYQLSLNPGYGDPTWRVIWGESVSSSAFSVLVDASTGAFVETLR
jgi:hypothetical protein